MAKAKRYNGEEESLIEAGSGVSDRYNPPEEKPAGGRFDEDTYARARRFLERGGEEEAPAPVAKSRPKAVAKPAAPARKATAEDIPGQSVKAPDGNRIDSSETGRNLKNIMAAATPAAVRGTAAIGRGLGALASSAKAGFQAGRAERRAELAEQLRRGQAGTKFESKSSKPTSVKRTRKYNEDEMSTEFKKGGTARGWGAARGARKAKIY
jgi:hypothetical protein